MQNGWTDLNNLYVFLHSELPFGSRDDCIFVEILVTLFFKNRDF